MKKISLMIGSRFPLLAGIFFTLLLLSSCKKEQIAELTAPQVKAVMTANSWKLNKVYQYDPVTEKNIDITSNWDFSTFRLTFQTSGDQPSNYTITRGTTPFPVRTDGTWTFDDLQFPTAVIFNKGTSSEIKANLVSAPRSNSLKLKWGTSSKAGTSYYTYDFVPVQ